MKPLQIFLCHVCPGLGLIISVVSFASPLPAIVTAEKTKDLKGMNPLPFVAMAASCVRGAIYGQITHDWYIYMGNLVGMMLSWYFLLTVYKLCSRRDQYNVTVTTLAAVFAMVAVGSINLFRIVSCRILWGSTAVVFTTISYFAPLSSLVQIVRERDSSSILWPLSLTNLINAMLWFVYGMAKKDYYFIALPNAMGITFNTLSLLLCLVLPARARQQQQQHKSDPDSCSSSNCSSSEALSEPSIFQRLLRSFSRSSMSSTTDAACVIDFDESAFVDEKPREKCAHKHPHDG